MIAKRQLAEYPFVGIPKDAKLARALRIKIARDFGKLTDEQIAMMSEPNGSVFDILSGPLTELPTVQVEVFQSLIELRGGFGTIQGGEFIRLLGNEMRDPPWMPVCRKAGSWKILPPMEWLCAWDQGLYTRSAMLLRYACEARDCMGTFDHDWGRSADGRRLPETGCFSPAADTGAIS